MGVRLAATIAGTALLLGACAGDGETSKPGGAKGAFIAKGDPICAEIATNVGRLGDDPVKDRDAVRAGLDKLTALPAPGEDLEKVQVFLARLNNVALALEDVNQSRIQKDDPRAKRALATAREQDDLAADAAKSYGFVECGKGIPLP